MFEYRNHLTESPRKSARPFDTLGDHPSTRSAPDRATAPRTHTTGPAPSGEGPTRPEAGAPYFVTFTDRGALTVVPAALVNSTVYTYVPFTLPVTGSAIFCAPGVAATSVPEPTAAPPSRNR